MIKENRRRVSLRLTEGYNPKTGTYAWGERETVTTPLRDMKLARVPKSMTADARYAKAKKNAAAWHALRCEHDFEYWCVSCVKIKPKTGYEHVPFVLNRGQRKVLAVLEEQRTSGEPIRVIILKARQWGCSTLIQNYMAWIQMCLRPNWHSLICCHNKDSAVNIRRLYTDLIKDYPGELWAAMAGSDAKKPVFKPFEGSANVREISGRGCRVAVTSSESQDALRGYDMAMAHLSEAAYWKETATQSPDDLIRNVCGSVALMPYSLIVMESTANGTGNYFHDEWMRAKAGESDKKAVFVAWFETENNSLPLTVREEEFIESMNDMERRLWDAGCSLDQINWYRARSKADRDIKRFAAEYPSDDKEAFGIGSGGVFEPADIERMAGECSEPVHEMKTRGGDMEIWREAEPGGDYVVSVDIGGRAASSDWSVIAVMKRCDEEGGRHEVVAQWRGHADHDIVSDMAIETARHYNEALLVIESNSLESGAGADAGNYVLQRMAERYRNLYRRPRGDDKAPGQPSWRIGFHTNRATKALLVDTLIEAVREGRYVERSAEACRELGVYMQLPSGAYAAKTGHHDDIIMTRALALTAMATSRGGMALRAIPSPNKINVRHW